ncbi:MAG: antitoxin [Candidatus Diapherotrites archaeon]|nr:antitoxin [Candidatus Diapherotrites archaeon]
MKSKVISIRISKEAAEELERAGYSISEIAKKKLHEEYRKIKLKRLLEEMEKYRESFASISEREILKTIRKMRNDR